MKRSNGSRAIWAAAAMMMAVMWLPAGAAAQVSIDAGKTPQQVFATDCQPCHKDARTLSKGPVGLAAFLREHYSASRESAKVMADYLVRVGKGGPGAREEAPPAARRRGRESPPPAASGETREAAPEAAPGEGRPARPSRARGERKDGKAGAKPAHTKPADVKPEEANPAETKPAETKPAEPAPAEIKPAETKPVEPAPAETKPAEPKAEAPRPEVPKPEAPKPAETTKPADVPSVE